MDVVEEVLRQVLTELREVKAAVAASKLPALLSRPEAARLLGVGLDGLKGMVDRGEIFVRVVGEREMIPSEEIERFRKPADAPTRRPGGPRRGKYDAKEEAAKLRAALRKKR